MKAIISVTTEVTFNYCDDPDCSAHTLPFVVWAIIERRDEYDEKSQKIWPQIAPYCYMCGKPIKRKRKGDKSIKKET